jgi:hypothetical protein
MSPGYTAIVINLPDDEGKVRIEKVTCPAGDQASLGFLQGIVGRDAPGHYIEHVNSADDRIDFWLNEEGKLYGLPINNVATDILWALNPAFRGQDVLVGNVVLTSHQGPETASVPDGFWDRLRRITFLGYEIEFVDGQADG